MMSRIIVFTEYDNGNLVSAEDLTVAVVSIQQGLQDLGNLRKAVTKVVADYEGEVDGLDLVIHFRDPIGVESFYATDHRFIGNKDPKPSAPEIAKIFSRTGDLSNIMKKFLENSRSRIESAQQKLKRQLSA